MEKSENNNPVSEPEVQKHLNEDYSFPDLFNNSNNPKKENPINNLNNNHKLLIEFEQTNVEFAEWWNNTDYDFAISLRKSFLKNGKLSDKQLAAAKKCISKKSTKKNEIDIEQNDKIDQTGISGIAELVSAMWRARRNGVKEPKMRLFAENTSFNVVFENDENSKYNNSIRVLSDDGQFLGRILGKKFYKSNYTPDDVANQINETCSNVNKSAISYGRRTGSCSCCGRPLNNEESVRLGIGPTCRTYFFG